MSDKFNKDTILIVMAVVIAALIVSVGSKTPISFSNSFNETIGVSSGEIPVSIKSPLDPNTGVFMTVEYAHHEIHEGEHYSYRDFYFMPKNSVKEFLIITPNSTKQMHSLFGVQSTTSTISYNIFENCTVSNNGTLEPVRNRNRNFNNNNEGLLYEDPTITADGTEIAAGIYGSGKNSNGGGDRDTEEILLKVNETYCYRISEQNIASTNINILFDWYEHAPLN